MILVWIAGILLMSRWAALELVLPHRSVLGPAGLGQGSADQRDPVADADRCAVAGSASQVRVPGGRVSMRHVPGGTGKARPGRQAVWAPSLPVMGGAGPREFVH
jgi:hypothetical protein